MSFIWPPEGDFGVIAKLASQEAANTFDPLIFQWESTFSGTRIIIVCLEHGINIFESNSTQLYNEWPYEGDDTLLISSLDAPGLSKYATYPTSCEIVLKDWEAIDDPPDLGFNGTTQYGTIGHLFLVTSNDATSTMYEPSTSTVTSIEAITTKTFEASTTKTSTTQPSSSIVSGTSSTSLSTLAVVNTNTTSSANPLTIPLPPPTTFTPPGTTMSSTSLPFTDSLTLSPQPTPSSSPTTPTHRSTPLKIGLGVGIAIGSLIFIALIVLIFLLGRKLRRRRQATAEQEDMMLMTPSRVTAGLKSELPAYAEKPEEKRLFEVCDEGKGRGRWELESPRGGVVDGLLLGGGGGGGGWMHELDEGRDRACRYHTR